MALLWGTSLLSESQDFKGLWPNSLHGVEGKEFKPKLLATFHLVKLWERNPGTCSPTGGRIRDQGGIPGLMNADRLPSRAVGLARVRASGQWSLPWGRMFML